jgi:hypothetical protein
MPQCADFSFCSPCFCTAAKSLPYAETNKLVCVLGELLRSFGGNSEFFLLRLFITCLLT